VKKISLGITCFFGAALCVSGLQWAPAHAQEASASLEANRGRDRILALRRGGETYSREDIEFMVRVVFADAMNLDRWVNQWIRKNHIPSVTHLIISPEREGVDSEAFTVLRLPERAKHRIVVVKGFRVNPRVRRWMSIRGLLVYFRDLTTSRGEVRAFESGFLGLKGVWMGLHLKKLMDDLHERGLMRTQKDLPLSEEQKRENSTLRSALDRS
jgi:hypothetical protein